MLSLKPKPARPQRPPAPPLPTDRLDHVTIAALLLCMVIVTLFLEVMLDAPLRWLVGALFAASTLGLVVGLAYFLREVHLAMQSVQIRIPSKGD